VIEAAITPKTKAIILNTPSNPSGAVVAREDLEAIVRLAHKHGIYVLLDECYVYLTFTGEIVSGGSFTECKEHIVVLGSLSKTYAMTGWRAGFALGPKPIIAAMSKLQSQSTSNTASMVQRASIAALTESQECVSEMRADYIKLRDQILAGFKTIPDLTCTVPQGAFYVYPNVRKFLGRGGITSASDLAAKLLSEAHVVVVPGEAFGTAEHIRLSYAVSHDVVDEGVKRMRDYFATLS
jgi:aspartate aminotransferase